MHENVCDWAWCKWSLHFCICTGYINKRVAPWWATTFVGHALLYISHSLYKFHWSTYTWTQVIIIDCTRLSFILYTVFLVHRYIKVTYKQTHDLSSNAYIFSIIQTKDNLPKLWFVKHKNDNFIIIYIPRWKPLWPRDILFGPKNNIHHNCRNSSL